MKTKGVLLASPGTIIKNLSSHIPTFTNIEVQNIIAILFLYFFTHHIGTGIRYPVTKKIINNKFHGHWNICISLNAISGASWPYKAKVSSKKVHANQPVATTINNLANDNPDEKFRIWLEKNENRSNRLEKLISNKQIDQLKRYNKSFNDFIKS